MSESVISYVTISCDTPSCDKTVTFVQTEEGGKQAFAANPWMNSIRVVQTVDGRKFVYCSDSCEASAVGFGQHNKKTIVSPTSPDAIKQAADAAARAAQATRELKSGGPVTLE